VFSTTDWSCSGPLIDSLIESLDQTVDEGPEEAWRREIEIRLEEIDGGAVKLITWRDARQRLRRA